jgi:hydrogenase maturation factor
MSIQSDATNIAKEIVIALIQSNKFQPVGADNKEINENYAKSTSDAYREIYNSVYTTIATRIQKNIT